VSEKTAKIKTTGELRQFLVDMMVGVKNGHLDLDQAGRITKLAAQVNENLYAEVKIAKIKTDMGEKMPTLGNLQLGPT
jgi:hypothetical protein